jgi:hypothetical protein
VRANVSFLLTWAGVIYLSLRPYPCPPFGEPPLGIRQSCHQCPDAISAHPLGTGTIQTGSPNLLHAAAQASGAFRLLSSRAIERERTHAVWQAEITCCLSGRSRRLLWCRFPFARDELDDLGNRFGIGIVADGGAGVGQVLGGEAGHDPWGEGAAGLDAVDEDALSRVSVANGADEGIDDAFQVAVPHLVGGGATCSRGDCYAAAPPPCQHVRNHGVMGDTE